MIKKHTESSIAHRSAFSEPMYRQYFPASCFSTLGSWLMRFLFGWSAWELTHSAFSVGVVAGCMLIPTIILSPLFGIVSDRINPRNGLAVTLLTYGLVAALTGLASMLDILTLPWLTGLSIVLGAVMSAHTPIRLALIPRLVSRQALPSAIGYNSMTFNSSRVIGPAVGAWLVSIYSVPFALFVVTFLCFTAMFFVLSIKGVVKEEREKPASFLNELKAGFAYASSNPTIRLIFTFVLLNSFLGRTLLELLPAFSGQQLQGTAETLATLSASAGAGAIVGSLFISRQGGDEKKLFRLVAISLIMSSFCLFSIQYLSGLFQYSVLIFMVSMIGSVAGIGTQALTQLTVEEAYRGRVLSLWAMLAMGAPAIGAIVVGALTQSWGFALISAVIAVITLMILGILRAMSR